MDDATIAFVALGTALAGYGLYLKLQVRRLRDRFAHMHSAEGAAA